MFLGFGIEDMSLSAGTVRYVVLVLDDWSIVVAFDAPFTCTNLQRYALWAGNSIRSKACEVL